MSAFERLRRDEKGGVAVFMMILLIPLMGVVGMSIDVLRMASERGHVQDALDAAALAGAKTMQTEGAGDDVSDAIYTVFEQNMSGAYDDLDCEPLAITQSLADGEVEVNISCTIPATISAVVGHDAFTFNEAAKVAFGVNKLEVAFMFDVSGSMSGDKLEDLKDAADGALDVLFDLPVAAEGDVRVSMNSYSTALNVGEYFEDVTGEDETHEVTFDLPNTSEITGVVTNTCVSERTGSHAFTDEEPANGRWIGSDAPYCPLTSVVPLTSDRVVLDDMIEDLSVATAPPVLSPQTAWTAGQLGVAWTWYTLSPEWTGIWPNGSDPEPYDTEDLAKVAILMTDGQFNTVYDEDTGSSSEQAIEMCDAMKGAGVLVFAVAFEAPSSAENTLRDCSSGSDYFFDADNGAELEEAYQLIAVRISDLRVSS
ncbi:MAG: pilus assembly protein TadG-related protein [Pseudomonadota bacterium]